MDLELNGLNPFSEAGEARSQVNTTGVKLSHPQFPENNVYCCWNACYEKKKHLRKLLKFSSFQTTASFLQLNTLTSMPSLANLLKSWKDQSLWKWK